MSDIKTVFIGFGEGADYVQDALGLAEDSGLETALIISLFTDRRAEDDDTIPDGSQEKRGWWGDDFNEQRGDRIGSRLWLLSREKQLSGVLGAARQYAEEALRWLIDDSVAELIEVEASIPRDGILGLAVSVSRPHHPVAQYRFDVFWSV
jgi:phage gp46-like protein